MITAILTVYLWSCLNMFKVIDRGQIYKNYNMPNHSGDLLTIIFQTACHFASQRNFAKFSYID